MLKRRSRLGAATTASSGPTAAWGIKRRQVISRGLCPRTPGVYRFWKLRMGRKIKGRASALPIRLLPYRALRLLSSRALSSRWAGRIYHEPLNGKKLNFLTQNGPKKGDRPSIHYSNITCVSVFWGQVSADGQTAHPARMVTDAYQQATLTNFQKFFLRILLRSAIKRPVTTL